jgi:hypothetical protein
VIVMIASARMYSWSPSLLAAWRRLLEWVGERSGVGFDVLDPSAEPASLDELWARPDMACVFMCGYPWALRESRPHLLAAPVPSPPRFGGRPDYVSDFIVRADSGFKDLADTFGGAIAYSAEHSHSGYNAPRFHLLPHRTAARPQLYSTVLGPFVRQRPVIDAVSTAAPTWPRSTATARPAPSPRACCRAPARRRHECRRPRRRSSPRRASTSPRARPSRRSAPVRPRGARHGDDARPASAHALRPGPRPEVFEIFLERERAAEAAGYRSSARAMKGPIGFVGAPEPCHVARDNGPNWAWPPLLAGLLRRPSPASRWTA